MKTDPGEASFAGIAVVDVVVAAAVAVAGLTLVQFLHLCFDFHLILPNIP